MEFNSLREKIAYETVQRKQRHSDYELWLKEAHEAGMKAANSAEVVPMVVRQHENPLDDSSAVVKEYFVGDGVCGFAWVTVRPGNSSFALFAKKNGWKPAYSGGIQYWVSGFGQSMQRKFAYAGAFAGVLCSHGVKAYAHERMD